MKNSAFVYCSHCGDQFFKTDLRRTQNGPVCVICLARGTGPVNGI